MQGLAGSISVSCFGDPVLADQRLGQPVRVVDVVEAEAALDAEPVVVGRPVLAVDRDDAVVLDLIGQLAADAAIGADAVDLAVGRVGVDAVARRPAPPASARRSGRPARIRRRRRRCCCPSGRRNRTRSSRAGRAPAMPITSLTCTSRQARTHRLHWMQASSCTAIAGWLRSGAGGGAQRKAAVARRRPGRPIARSDEFGSCAAARAGWSPTSSSNTILREKPWRARSRSAPSCPASACGCTRRRAPARPRSRPCRRGNCRRRDSRASAASTDAGSRCPGGSPPARSSRPAAPRPRRRRGESGSDRSSQYPRSVTSPQSSG